MNFQKATTSFVSAESASELSTVAAKNASSDEEEDYMSDALLEKVGDVRPGVLSASAARKFRIEQQQKEEVLKAKEKRLAPKLLEVKNRSEALSVPLSTECKGFALMEKMGFKQGMSLGKREGGIVEPIGIELKKNRSGLGHEAEMEKQSKDRVEAHLAAASVRSKMEAVITVDYRSRKRELAEQKQLEGDLFKSQKSCRELDARLGQEFPMKIYFWHHYEPSEEEAEFFEEAEEELSVEQKLTTLTQYLRATHKYCVWCGTQFATAEELSAQCPGDTKNDHS